MAKPRRWTDKDRDKVIFMLGQGESQVAIAKKLRCSVSSLHRHFKELLVTRDGPAPHAFTDAERSSAIAMASYGISQTEIAAVLGCSRTTLMKHIGDDMAKAPTQANSNVARSLYRSATRDNNTTAQVFWMKARAGWADRVTLDGSVGVRGSVSHDHTHQLDVVALARALSPEGRAALRVVVEEMRRIAPQAGEGDDERDEIDVTPPSRSLAS